MDAKKRGVIYVIISMVLFSTGGLFIKIIETNAFTITFTRAMFAALVFVPFIEWKKIKITKAYVALVLSYCYLCIIFVLTTKITTAANAIILQCTAPLWLYLFYIIRGKKITGRELIPRLFILLGIIVILCDSKGGNIYGNLLALTNGVAYAIVQYFLEKKFPFSDQTVVGLNNIVLCAVILIIMPRNLDFLSLTFSSWLSLAFLGVFQIGLSYLILFKGVKLISALEASIISLVEPLLNPILVFFVIGEMPSVFALVGFGIILFGIGLTLVPERTKKRVK